MRLRRNSQEVQNTRRTVPENNSVTRSRITFSFVIFSLKIERISLGNRGFQNGGWGYSPGTTGKISSIPISIPDSETSQPEGERRFARFSLTAFDFF